MAMNITGWDVGSYSYENYLNRAGLIFLFGVDEDICFMIIGCHIITTTSAKIVRIFIRLLRVC